LARDGEIILAELKTGKGTLTREQKVWLQHIGDRGYVWRPARPGCGGGPAVPIMEVSLGDQLTNHW
jgi:hypothetical protein